MAGYLSKIVTFACLSIMTTGMRFPNTTLVFIASATAAQNGSSLLLKDDPSLKESVNVEVTNMPVGDMLIGLSQKSKVDFSADSPIRNQRVTLHLDKQPLHHIMGRLAGLLCHSPLSPRGYHWEKLKRGDAARPGYRLWRDSKSLREEQDALDYPRRKAAQLLRDFRNLSRMSAEQRKAYRGDLHPDYLTQEDLQPFRDALSGLSDTDVETLIAEGSVPLDTVRFADRIAAYNQTWHDQELLHRERAISSGAQDPYPNGVPDRPPTPPAMTYHVDDNDGQRPERSTLYGLFLEGAKVLDLPPGQSGSMHSGFNPYQFAGTPLAESKEQTGPILDLTPLLTGVEVTPEQRGDIGFTLQALAKAAKINVYEEAFYMTVQNGARSKGLQRLKGTLPQLLNVICKEWGYQVKKAGDDYVMWSNTWAQDRTRDIPEPLLAKWRTRGEKQAGYTLDDRIEMASLLNWPQICLTLRMAIEKTGPWYTKREADVLRFIGRFSPAERTMLEQEGLPFAAMDAWHQQALAGELLNGPQGARNLSAVQVERSHLNLTNSKDSVPYGYKPLDNGAFLQIKTESGASLWHYALAATAVKVGTQKSR